LGGFVTARWRKSLLVSGGIVAAILGFLTWYRAHYSMEPARSYELPGAASAPKVLIATQGSEFKDAVVAGLVDHLKDRRASVKVIDVSALSRTNVDGWNAIVVIHTWELRKPPAAVKAFIERTGDRSKLIVLTTSGAGDFKTEGVDAVSAASRMTDFYARVEEISARVDATLAGEVRP
jgi:hypothetical protein